MNAVNSKPEDIAKRRAAARRTAWKLAILAGIIFTVFYLTGVVGRG